MPIKNYTPEQIVTILRQIAVQMANGKTAPHADEDNTNAAALLHNKQPAAPVPGRGKVERRRGSADTGFEFDGGSGVS